MEIRCCARLFPMIVLCLSKRPSCLVALISLQLEGSQDTHGGALGFLLFVLLHDNCSRNVLLSTEIHVLAHEFNVTQK